MSKDQKVVHCKACRNQCNGYQTAAKQFFFLQKTFDVRRNLATRPTAGLQMELQCKRISL